MDGLELSNAYGQVVIRRAEPVQELNLSELPAGVYLVEVNVEGSILMRKFVKE